MLLTSLALVLALAPVALPSAASAAPCTPVRTPFIGSICAPATPGKHPAIVLLGGSEGGDTSANVMATMFAKQGYVAVAVAYFGIADLPKVLINVPVDPIGKALDVVAARPDVDAQRIAVFGISKGGELALLAASIYPQIHAVVAAVPSPFAWQGIAQGPGAAESSWTVGGKPVPFVAFGTAMGQVFASTFMQHKSLDLRPGYDGAMTEHADQIPAAMFHLENVKGPILFIAAADDQIWNSVRQSNVGLAYLKSHQHAYADRMLEYPNAGHIFLFATPARPMLSVPFANGVTMMLGGTPDGNVAAAKAAWPEIFGFLTRTFSIQKLGLKGATSHSMAGSGRFGLG